MNYQLDRRPFFYFLTLAEELHFRKASERLHISQPALSKQIMQLEEQLRMKLFYRHNRKVELSSAGQYLQKRLAQHFKQFDEIIHHAQLLNQGLQGELKLGFVGSAMQQVIPNLLLDFERKYPSILIQLTELDNRQQVHQLLNHDLDVGFVRMDQLPHPLKTRALFEDTFSLVLPENHPLNASTFESIAQVKDEAFILFDPAYSESYYAKVMQIFEAHAFEPKVSHSTVNASSIFRLVENELGISIVPSALRSGFNMRVKFIEMIHIPQRTTLKMVWNTENHNPVLQPWLEDRSASLESSSRKALQG